MIINTKHLRNAHLLDDKTNQPSKQQNIGSNHAHESYDRNSQIKFMTAMFKSNLCYDNDVYHL